jgi:hypothetical protein
MARMCAVNSGFKKRLLKAGLLAMAVAGLVAGGAAGAKPHASGVIDGRAFASFGPTNIVEPTSGMIVDVLHQHGGFVVGATTSRSGRFGFRLSPGVYVVRWSMGPPHVSPGTLLCGTRHVTLAADQRLALRLLCPFG